MTDPRIVQLAEARYRDSYGATSEDAWDQLDTGLKQFLTGEAEAWLNAAISIGLLSSAETHTT
ncbi:hypothetical protein ACFVTY_01970 [Streptomyces sp. NPDC058067]|uniref:hypothetical protein n=1 Tax=Streptomyces sp. NPDC058067 TaxID=3346324 RepID=UPI0036E6B46A